MKKPKGFWPQLVQIVLTIWAITQLWPYDWFLPIVVLIAYYYPFECFKEEEESKEEVEKKLQLQREKNLRRIYAPWWKFW